LDNWSATGPIRGPGVPENVVDNPGSPGGRSPYYDDGAAANASDFFDYSIRDPDTFGVTWEAELFLVSGPAPTAPGRVTVYDGVRWGWVVPEPSSLSLFLFGILLLWTLRHRLQEPSPQEIDPEIPKAVLDLSTALPGSFWYCLLGAESCGVSGRG